MINDNMNEKFVNNEEPKNDGSIQREGHPQADDHPSAEERPMPHGRICDVCNKLFVANKYRPNQKICSSLECQYERQLHNMKSWRKRNPNYFKYKEITDARWKESCRERARNWRQNHLEYLKLYRQEHKDQHREYMKKYMREYRKKKKETQ